MGETGLERGRGVLEARRLAQVSGIEEEAWGGLQGQVARVQEANNWPFGKAVGKRGRLRCEELVLPSAGSAV